jgi:ribonuclease III
VAEPATFQSRLDYHFRDPGLLQLALTHPSVVHEQPGAAAHNQRLEFLGDAVLQLVLTRELFIRYPAQDEGELTKARARLVNQAALAARARALELGAHLILSRAEDANGGRERPSILADAFESLCGAVFLDGGYESARAVILRQFAEELAEVDAATGGENPKGELQELLQAQSQEAPAYELIAASGPDHDREFECAVRHRGEELGRGRGKSKKTAEAGAAQAALQRLRAERAAGGVETPA